MSDVLRPDRLDEVAIADRRKTVAAFYLNRVTQAVIAQKLGCSRQTVSADLVALKAEWKAEHQADVDAAIVRDLAELDMLESQAAAQFAAHPDVGWLNCRLACKTRRAKLLGMDAPSRIDATTLGQPMGGEWQELRTLIMLTLETYPEARAALAEALDADDCLAADD